MAKVQQGRLQRSFIVASTGSSRIRRTEVTETTKPIPKCPVSQQPLLDGSVTWVSIIPAESGVAIRSLGTSYGPDLLTSENRFSLQARITTQSRAFSTASPTTPTTLPRPCMALNLLILATLRMFARLETALLPLRERLQLAQRVRSPVVDGKWLPQPDKTSCAMFSATAASSAAGGQTDAPGNSSETWEEDVGRGIVGDGETFQYTSCHVSTARERTRCRRRSEELVRSRRPTMLFG
jgi:hypothetical protein